MHYLLSQHFRSAPFNLRHCINALFFIRFGVSKGAAREKDLEIRFVCTVLNSAASF